MRSNRLKQICYVDEWDRMAFCMKCGKKLPKGTEFCPKCGAQIGAVAKIEERDHSDTGGILMLVGGILAIVFSIFPLAFMSMWGGMMGGMMGGMGRWSEMGGGWNMPMAFGWIRGFMIAGAIISIVLGIVAFYAYKRVKGGEVKSGGTIAIIIGVIMLLTMNWLPGIITLIGGILCYTSK